MAGPAEWRATTWSKDAPSTAVSPDIPAEEKELLAAAVKAENAWQDAVRQGASYRKEEPADPARFNERRMALLAAIQPLASSLSSALAAQEALLAALDWRLRQLGGRLPAVEATANTLRTSNPVATGRPVREAKP